jgi:hypothetical protein
MQLELKECVRIKCTKPPDVEILDDDKPHLAKYERLVLKALAPDVIRVDKRREAFLARAAVEIIKDVRIKLRFGYSRKATIERYKKKIKSMARRPPDKPTPKEILWLMLAEDAGYTEQEILQRSPESPRSKKPRPARPDALSGRLLDYYFDLEANDMWLVHDNDSFNESVSEITTAPSRSLSAIERWRRSAEMEGGGDGGYSGGGFGGCACACACAGCACACAGGGR